MGGPGFSYSNMGDYIVYSLSWLKIRHCLLWAVDMAIQLQWREAYEQNREL